MWTLLLAVGLGWSAEPVEEEEDTTVSDEDAPSDALDDPGPVLTEAFLRELDVGNAVVLALAMREASESPEGETVRDDVSETFGALFGGVQGAMVVSDALRWRMPEYGRLPPDGRMSW